MHYKSSSYFLLLVLSFLPFQLNAQMFSVKDIDNKVTNPYARSHFWIGYAMFDFKYIGSAAISTNQDLSFNEPVYTARLQFQETEFSFSTAFNVGPSGNSNYNRLFLKSGSLIPLYSNKFARLYLPLSIYGHYERISNREFVNVDSNYDQLGVLLGSGLVSSLRVQKLFDIDLRADFYGGFTSRNFSQGNGIERGLRTRAVLNVPSIIRGIGLSAGYEFEIKSVNTNFELSNYGSTSHGLLIGVNF